LQSINTNGLRLSSLPYGVKGLKTVIQEQEPALPLPDGKKLPPNNCEFLFKGGVAAECRKVMFQQSKYSELLNRIAQRKKDQRRCASLQIPANMTGSASSI
jgi:hypothetical protein